MNSYFTLKKEDMLYINKLVKDYKLLIKTMKLFGEMQRVYQRGKEFFEFIYSTAKEIKVSNRLSQVVQKTESSNEAVNEFIFMPYINTDGFINTDQNTSKNKLKLREEYIASVVRSTIQRHKDYKRLVEDVPPAKENFILYGTLHDLDMAEYDKLIKKVKYGLKEELPFDYTHDFGSEINKNLLKMLRDKHHKIHFNHYDIILKKLKENPNLLEGYYKEEDLEKDGLIFTHIDGKIKLNPEAETKLEYKYNPQDFIVGGELEIWGDHLYDNRKMCPGDEIHRSIIANGANVNKFAEKVDCSLERKVVREHKLNSEEKKREKEKSGEGMKVAIDKVLAGDKNRA